MRRRKRKVTQPKLAVIEGEGRFLRVPWIHVRTMTRTEWVLDCHRCGQETTMPRPHVESWAGAAAEAWFELHNTCRPMRGDCVFCGALMIGGINHRCSGGCREAQAT